MFLIASATKQDRARVEEKLDRLSSAFSESISRIREEHQRQMTGMDGRVGDLSDWARNTVRSMRGGWELTFLPLESHLVPALAQASRQSVQI